MVTAEVYLQDFYITEESKRITRSTENGDLTTTSMINIPHPGFRKWHIFE
jgi:hypothetical protein